MAATTGLVAADYDSLKVMRYMRRKNIRTAQKYIHLDVSDLAGAANKPERCESPRVFQTPSTDAQ